jgi:hypothetical protein
MSTAVIVFALILLAGLLAVIEQVQAKGHSLTAWAVLALAAALLLERLG